MKKLLTGVLIVILFVVLEPVWKLAIASVAVPFMLLLAVAPILAIPLLIGLVCLLNKRI